MPVLLSIDVGKGTTDIVLYDGEVVLKAIVPSSTALIAKKIEESESDIVVFGHTMGGGPLTSAIRNHVKKYGAFMTRNAALSLSDDMEKMKSWGIRIIGEREAKKKGGKRIFLSDLDMDFTRRLISDAGFSFKDIGGFGLSLQDHGFSLASNRKNRFAIYRRLLQKNDFKIGKLYFRRVPKFFNRAHSAFSQIPFEKKIFLDSSYAAVFGVYLACGDCLAINVGNLHTLAALVFKGRILGLFEHHTSSLDASSLAHFVRLLEKGRLKDEDIFNSGGHGAFLKKAKRLPIVVTGPKGKMMEKTSLPFTHAYPLGDSMIPGNLALIEIMKRLSWG